MKGFYTPPFADMVNDRCTMVALDKTEIVFIWPYTKLSQYSNPELRPFAQNIESPMHVIAKRTLREFYELPNRADSREAIETWYREAKAAEWSNFGDIKRTYASASGVGNNRVVFNIHGNKYRLIVKLNYAVGVVYIRFIGTHSEYDRIDASTI